MNHISNMASSADMTLKPPGNFTLTGDLSVGRDGWNVLTGLTYMMATERDKKAGGIQVATLLTLMGPEVMDVYHLFDWGSEAEKHDISQVKEKFARYFTPRTNVTYERYKFLQKNQELGETFDAFLTDLKNLISSCKYHTNERDNILRDQIMMNITSNTVREKLLSKAELKLAETMDICRSSEITGQLMAGMS